MIRCWASGFSAGFAIFRAFGKWTIGLLVVSLLACASAPPADVPVEGTGSAVHELGGRWVGEYSSPATGRRGSIFFDLSGNRTNANGFVVMYTSMVPAPETSLTAASRVSGPATDVLAIDFVRAASGQITGQLAPYRDPATGSTLRTRFEGKQNGDVIEGTFESHAEGSTSPIYGTWKVVRQRR